MHHLKLVSFLIALTCGFNMSCAAQNDDEFEMAKTKELLGGDVVDLSQKLQPSKRLEIKDLRALEFTANVQPFAGKNVPQSFHQRTIVHATSKADKEYAAFCGSPKNEIFDSRDKFTSDLGNRRHRYRDMYHPPDVIIGSRQDKMITPLLFFRDVGSHTTRPHAFSVDDDNKAHLIVSDVLISSENR